MDVGEHTGMQIRRWQVTDPYGETATMRGYVEQCFIRDNGVTRTGYAVVIKGHETAPPFESYNEAVEGLRVHRVMAGRDPDTGLLPG